MVPAPPRRVSAPNVLKTEPAAVYVSILGAAAALTIQFAHLNPSQAAYLAAAVTAAGSALTAALARPAHLPAVSGAAGVIVQALILSGMHLTAGQEAAVVAAVNLILGYVIVRPQVTPLANSPAAPPGRQG